MGRVQIAPIVPQTQLFPPSTTTTLTNMNNYAEQALEADSTPLRPISSLQPKVIVPVASPDPALSSSSANTSTPGPPSQASGDEPPTFRRRIRLRPPRKTGVTTNTEVA